MDSGRAHSIPNCDIYGALYHHVSDALRKFSARLHRFKISFLVIDEGLDFVSEAILAGKIPKEILSPDTKFDRIEVSNLMDSNHLGVQDVLESWAPLLSRTIYAAIIGSFMNWVVQQDGAHVDHPSVRDYMGIFLRNAGKAGKVNISNMLFL